jgi:hypothetical protein
MKCCLTLLIIPMLGVDAFSSTPSKIGKNRLTATDSKLALFSRSESAVSEARHRKCARCPDDEDDDNSDLDRREALFAMLGSMLATSVPTAAWATYGDDAKIELPNPIEAISNRANGQCLVETLGNRECLVYLDPANKLYQGADNAVLLERMERTSQSLASIPDLIEQKKWSQVSGVLLGPLGTLVETMNQLTKLSANGSKAAALASKTKSDMYDIFQAAERKQGDKALIAHDKATKSLVAFVKSL